MSAETVVTIVGPEPSPGDHLRALKGWLSGVEERYGAEHVVARSVRQARSEVERSTAFVEGRLGEVAAS